MTTMVKSSEMSVIGLIRRDEPLLVPLAALGLDEHEAGQHPGEERNPEVDEHALGNRPDRDSRQVDVAEAQPTSGGSTVMKT